jgi:hypothetical protein
MGRAAPRHRWGLAADETNGSKRLLVTVYLVNLSFACYNVGDTSSTCRRT